MGSLFNNKCSYFTARRGARTIVFVLVCVTLCVCFAACRSPKKGFPEGIRIDGGGTLEMGAPLNEAPFDGLLERQESNSCIGSGTDVYYKYEGFSVTAYPDGKGGHYVGMVKITGTGIETLSGLRVGLTDTEITGKYGSEIKKDADRSAFVLHTGETEVTAYMDSTGSVTQIVLSND